MVIPVLRTKITPPHRKDEILTRPRLNQLFDDLLDRKLVIVTAPAGYGKSSLMIDLAHHFELPFCWYSLDPLDKEIQRFLTHFITSIQSSFPDFGGQSLAALQVFEAGNLPLDHLQVSVVNEIYQAVREHFVIVLDDYHLVDSSPEVNAFINWFVQEVDQNCHLVILSRSLLSLPDLPLMVARSQVSGIGMQELAFRIDEIQALMLQNYHQVLPEAVANELAQKTEGWITGLLLSAQTMWQGMVDRLRLVRVSGVGLYDYLIHEVLDQQPPELQEFLLKTSFLDEFNAELCATLLGEPFPGHTWQEYLENVLSHNLFVVRIGEEGGWLRYHPLFQEFLQNRLAEGQPDETRRILEKLVSVYADRSEWERAYLKSRRLADAEMTADLLERAAGPLVTSGRITLLRNWLEEQPHAVLNQRPILLARQGLVLATQGHTSHGLRLLDQAVEHFRTSADSLHLAWTLVWRSLVHYIRASYSDSLADADEALALAEGKERDQDYAWVRPEAYRIRGQCYRALGRLDEAISNHSQSLILYEAQANHKNVNLVLLNLGAAYLDAGDFISALSCFNRALDYYQRQNNPFSLSSVLNDLAFLHYLSGEYLQAFTTFEDALSKARQSTNLRVEALVLIGMGDLYLDLEAFQAASDSYRQARPIIEQIKDRFLMIYLDLAEAAVARLTRDYSHASVLLNAASQIIEQSPNDYFRSLYFLEIGRLALAEKDYPRAAEVLADAAASLEAGGQKIEGARSKLLLAASLFELGETRLAEEHLAEVFKLVAGLENGHCLVSSARLVKPFLQASAASRRQGRKVLRLLDQVTGFEGEIIPLQRRLRQQSTVVTPGPPRLRVRAFGAAQVLLGDKAVASSDWQTQVTRDLFFLILSDPRGWSKESIGEILWPESSPAQLRLRFKNTIYRLRRALQQDVILFDGERYSFNRQLDYEYDVEQFLGFLSQAKEETDAGQKIKAYQSALKYYQGDFLPDIGGAWVVPEQERLRAAFLKAGLELARLYLESQQYDQSLEVSQRLIAAEPYLEEAYVAAMYASAASGNRPAVARVYEKLKQTLHDELGTPPSPHTDHLYHTLLE